MYHYISDLPPGADRIRRDLTVTPAIFRTHLQYLKDNGYTTTSFIDLHAALNQGGSLPARPVILTFDDGYTDHYQSAFPLLREFGMTGTFFIITGRVDANDRAYLTWEQVREMANSGMSLEAHTKTHPDLRNRPYEFLVYEILGSIESLTAYTGQRPRVLSYPAGQYDATVLQVVEQAKLSYGVTTQPGRTHSTDNRFEMLRLRVHGNTSAAGLAAILTSSP